MANLRQVVLWTFSRYKRFIVMLAITYCLGMVIFSSRLLKSVSFIFLNENMNEPCTIPAPDPFDPTIMKYHWIPEPLACDATTSLVYVDQSGILRMNTSVLGSYGVDGSSDVKCEVRNVVRSGDYDISFSDPIFVTLPFNMTSDFARVTCRNSASTVLYDNIQFGIKPKPKKLFNNGKTGSKRGMNIVLIGIDSVSRSASIRHLAKTRATLEKLGGYDFKGYMKIGDNTGPNVMSMLTGYKLDASEFPVSYGSPLDDAPFIWKNLSARGYATLYSEDVPHRAVFNTMFKGFQKEPTDHYMRPYFLAQNAKDNVQYKISGVLRFLENRGMNVKKGSVFCYQDKPKHEIILDYLRHFLLQYNNTPTFSFTFLTELSHSFINFLAYGDAYFSSFASWTKESGILDNTVLVFFGDHGPRYTDIRNTFVGRIESRMPFLNVLIPNRLKKKYPDIDKSLRTNRDRLVTVYDIHQTIVDIMNNNFDTPSSQILSDGSERGISLFKKIPKLRTCAQAWIPEEFCACYKSTAINVTNNDKLKQISNSIVNRINQIISEESQCHALSLYKTLTAELMSPGLKHSGYVNKGFSLFQFTQPEQNRERFRVSIETIPGHAMFDATCEFSDTLGIKVIGEIDRTNMYGNQSICTPHYHLKPYCYCPKS